MKKIISVTLLIVGLLLIVAPTVIDGYAEAKQKALLSVYEDDSTYVSEIVEMHLEWDEKDEDVLENEPVIVDDLSSYELHAVVYKEPQNEAVVEIQPADPIGILTIPAIDFRQVIMPTASQKDLAISVGHVEGTNWLDEEGNVAIAGHRSKKFGKNFNRLEELQKGDTILVESHSQNSTYEIYEHFIVEPSEVWVLQPLENKNIITLITCIPMENPTHRLIVRGIKSE